jgi:hypothetical protein
MSEPTLFDLINRRVCWVVKCRACGHESTVLPFSVGRKLPWSATLADVRPLLCCSECKARDVQIWEAGR